jgi:hypothetical protein
MAAPMITVDDGSAPASSATAGRGGVGVAAIYAGAPSRR